MGATMFCLAWMSSGVLYWVASRFLDRLVWRKCYSYNRKTRSVHCSKQLFIQGHESGNLSMQTCCGVIWWLSLVVFCAAHEYRPSFLFFSLFPRNRVAYLSPAHANLAVCQRHWTDTRTLMTPLNNVCTLVYGVAVWFRCVERVVYLQGYPLPPPPTLSSVLLPPLLPPQINNNCVVFFLNFMNTNNDGCAN